MINGKKTQNDETSREAIVSKLGDNAFVEASAGSGKTYSLVLRMVALVEGRKATQEQEAIDSVPVDKICTITFTKAAADEFFSRFQALLSARSVLTPDESEDQIGKKTPESIKRCQEALANIDSCFMGTIDAFCNMIAHELPSELNIPSGAQVIEQADFVPVVKEENSAILKDPSDPLHADAMRFRELIDSSGKALTMGVLKFRDVRNTEIVYDPRKLARKSLNEVFQAEQPRILAVIKELVGFQKECFLNSNKAANLKRLKAHRSLKGNYYDLKNNESDWSKCYSAFGYALKNIKDMDLFAHKACDYDNQGILFAPKEDANAKYTEAFAQERQAWEDKLNDYKYAVFCDYVFKLRQRLEDKLKNEGKFQYFDFLYYLNEAFKESAKTQEKELIHHILERHSHFLLDESQDTNPLQTEMFFRLTGTVYDDDWRKTKPRPGSLFIVGDPKQSIYAFRGANVKAYLETKAVFEAQDQVLVLTRNFRSNVQLRRWFNDVMDGLLNNGEPESLEHLPIPIDPAEEAQEKKDIAGNDIVDGVYSYNLDNVAKEPEMLAQLILDWVGNKKIYVKNRKRTEQNKDKEPKKKAREVRFGDFLIVPRSTDAPAIIEALDRHHIPLTIEAKIPYGQCASLLALRDLLLALKDPHEKTRFLDLIQGNLYQKSDKDILLLLNSGFDLDITHEANIADRELNDVIQQLKRLYEETKDMGYSSTLLYLLNDKELDLVHQVSASRLEYAYFLVQKIKEKEESASLSTVKDVDRLIQKFIEGSDDQRSLRFKDKQNRVKLSNVHKVKGLQAPIVILAKPSGQKKDPESYMDYSLQKPKSYFFGFKNPDRPNAFYVKTTQFDDPQKEDARESNEAEKRRLEYVGATRAEAVLIVGNVPKRAVNYESPWGNLYQEACGKPYNSGNFDIHSLKPIEDRFEKASEEESQLGSFESKAESHQQSFRIISPSQTRVKRTDNNLDEIEDPLPIQEKTKDAATVGTLIHRLMELIVSSKGRYSLEDAVDKVLKEHSADPAQYEETLKNVGATIRNGGFVQKNSPVGDDILKITLSSERAWCETPFAYQTQKGDIIHGIIDLIYLDKEGKYHIIDYKTGEEDDVSVLEEKPEYKGQLDHYRFALKKMGIDADAHIYHIKAS